MLLQQLLPFTVLKRTKVQIWYVSFNSCNSSYRLRYWNDTCVLFSTHRVKLQQLLPFTVLKPTDTANTTYLTKGDVATALTVYGIETSCQSIYRFSSYLNGCNSSYRLRYWNWNDTWSFWPFTLHVLQQLLPFTVLKPYTVDTSYDSWHHIVATALTVYGIETKNDDPS